jgi:hypothetical protein
MTITVRDEIMSWRVPIPGCKRCKDGVFQYQGVKGVKTAEPTGISGL